MRRGGIDIRTEKRSALTLALFAVYLLALVWLILFKLQFFIPATTEGRIVNWIPLLGSFDDQGLLLFSEIRANLLAFLPLGVYLSMLDLPRSFWRKALAMAGLAFVFETIQFIFAIGRADITDVLSNTLGGVVGLGLYALLRKVLKGRTNEVLNVLAAVLTALAVGLVATLVASQRWIRIR